MEKYIPPNYKDWIILDEVQKIPALLNEVHRLIEDKKYKFILTGSSARSLRKKGTNLLAGRALTYYFHPLIQNGSKGLLAFEIKRKSVITNKDLNGLNSFYKDYPQAKCYIFCSTNKQEYRDNISIMPIKDAIKKLSAILKNML